MSQVKRIIAKICQLFKVLEADLLLSETKILGASCVSELKLSYTLGNYYECISMTYYPQVGSEAANTLPFLQLGTRLFTLSRIKKDYNK